jgi:hypothetical protein
MGNLKIRVVDDCLKVSSKWISRPCESIKEEGQEDKRDKRMGRREQEEWI